MLTERELLEFYKESEEISENYFVNDNIHRISEFTSIQSLKEYNEKWHRKIHKDVSIKERLLEPFKGITISLPHYGEYHQLFEFSYHILTKTNTFLDAIGIDCLKERYSDPKRFIKKNIVTGILYVLLPVLLIAPISIKMLILMLSLEASVTVPLLISIFAYKKIYTKVSNKAVNNYLAAGKISKEIRELFDLEVELSKRKVYSNVGRLYFALSIAWGILATILSLRVYTNDMNYFYFSIISCIFIALIGIQLKIMAIKGRKRGIYKNV